MYTNKQLIFCGNLIFYTYFSGKFHIGVDESNRCMCMCVGGGRGGEQGVPLPVHFVPILEQNAGEEGSFLNVH